jgi:hypothetical protein
MPGYPIIHHSVISGASEWVRMGIWKSDLQASTGLPFSGIVSPERKKIIIITMLQSIYWKLITVQFSKNSPLLRNPKINHCVLKSRQLDPTLSQLKPFSLKSIFILSSHQYLGLPSGPSLETLQLNFCKHFTSPLCVPHTSRLPLPPW